VKRVSYDVALPFVFFPDIGSYNQLRGIASFADPVSGKMAQRPTDLPIHGSRGTFRSTGTMDDDL
jgi:hypothetical protein